MGKFAENTWFEIEHCCNCGMAFAMPVDYQQRRRNDHETFYCPAGHGQHYTGKTKEQKLRELLGGRITVTANENGDPVAEIAASYLVAYSDGSGGTLRALSAEPILILLTSKE